MKKKLELNQRSIRFLHAALVSVMVAALLCAHLPAQSQSDPDDVFTDSAASKLLGQIAEGLQGHSARKMLGAFDLSRMQGGALFKEQITALFNRYDSIRVHFKLVEVQDNTAIVDAEMDESPANANDPPQHKSLQLRLGATKTSAGWKFMDLQPRNFFT